MNENEEIQDNDSLMNMIAKKGQVTINNNHYDDSFNVVVLKDENPAASFQSRLNTALDIMRIGSPIVKTVGKVISLSAPFWAPKALRLISEKLNTPQIQIGTYNQGRIETSENQKLTPQYRENIKLESNSGKFELFAETDEHPLTDYILYKMRDSGKYDVDLFIGFQYSIQKKNIFTEKFLPYLKRDDVVLYYTEKYLDNKNNYTKSITYKLEKGKDKYTLLEISVYGLNVYQTEAPEEIPNNRIEIIQ